MEGVLGLAALIGIIVVFRLFSRGVSKAVGVGLNKTVFSAGVKERNRFVGESVLFKTSHDLDPEELFEAAKSAIPFKTDSSFLGTIVSLAGEGDRVAMIDLRNKVAGDVGSVVISVDDIDGTTYARFTVATWLGLDGDVQSFGHLEGIQKNWLTSLRAWDPQGRVTRRSNQSLPDPGHRSKPSRPKPRTAGDEPRSVAKKPEAVERSPVATERKYDAQPQPDKPVPSQDVDVRRSCDSCDSEIPADAFFCLDCGMPTPPPPSEPEPNEVCTNCGLRYEQDHRFCKQCGTPRG